MAGFPTAHLRSGRHQHRVPTGRPGVGFRAAGDESQRARPAPDFGKNMRHPRRSTSQPSRWLRGIVEMTRRRSGHAPRIALGIALATILLGLLAILAVEWMSSPSFLTTTICHRHARHCAPRWMPTEHRVHELERLYPLRSVIKPLQRLFICLESLAQPVTTQG